MPKIVTALTPAQEKYIKENHKRQGIREMSLNIRSNFYAVRKFMLKKKLPFRVVNRSGRKEIHVASKGFFDYTQYENWLVG